MSNPTFIAALEWSKSRLPSGNIKPQRHGGTPPLPVPQQPLISSPSGIAWIPTPEAAPEPPPPYGRGHNLPSGNCGGLCDVIWGTIKFGGVVIIGGCVIAGVILAPEVVVAGAEACAMNPTTCETLISGAAGAGP